MQGLACSPSFFHVLSGSSRQATLGTISRSWLVDNSIGTALLGMLCNVQTRASRFSARKSMCMLIAETNMQLSGPGLSQGQYDTGKVVIGR
jgi:hypothetical protein